MFKRTAVIVTALLFNHACGNVDYWKSPNRLQPVQGLYVKPSDDGSTGDLYVAATEDNGVKSQWLTDQPVNFLPSSTGTATQHPLAAYPYTSSIMNLPYGDTVISNQKRSVINTPAVNLPYGIPGTPVTNDEKAIPYPYSAPVQTAAVTPPEGKNECGNSPAPVAPVYAHYSPLAYYAQYAQLLNAFAHAMSTAKDSENTDETSDTTTTPQNMQNAAMWPYGYPFQYVMVDPRAWAQTQSAALPESQTPTTTEAPATSTSEESEE